eukprot:g42145.t1
MPTDTNKQTSDRQAGFPWQSSLAVAGNSEMPHRVMCIETRRVYDSAERAAEECDIHYLDIVEACCKKKTAGGAHWRYVDLNENN